VGPVESEAGGARVVGRFPISANRELRVAYSTV
jgi:hypothetical protein